MQYNKGLAVLQDRTGATGRLSHCPYGYTVVRKFINNYNMHASCVTHAL